MMLATTIIFIAFLVLLSHVAVGSQLEAVTVKVIDGDNLSVASEPDKDQACLPGVACITETDLFKDVTINPFRWQLNRPVTFSFQTTEKFENFKYVHLAVHQVLNRPGSDIPKNVFKGFILRTYQIKPNTRYEATFLPPYFWNSGKYLLTLSLMRQGQVNLLLLCDLNDMNANLKRLVGIRYIKWY